MKVLVIGATGYLGRRAARALHAAGHHVTAVGRTESAREELAEEGYDAIAGDIVDPASLTGAAVASDAVLFVVQLQQPDAAEVESRVLRVLLDGLSASSKAFLYTSGVWYYGPTGDHVADEETPPNPPAAIALRPRIERIVLDAAKQAVRAIVVRPGDVYGEGKGLPAMFANSARERGTALTIGDGSNHWPVVHVDDLAELYVRALERAAPGDVFNATDGTSFTQREIAQAASRGAGRGGAVAEWPVEQARTALGPWVEALAMDQRISSAKAQALLGWAPTAPNILEDLERGSYLRSG